MEKIECIVKTPAGLTSRICAELVAEANRAGSCDITLYCEDDTADLKSIMNMMSLIITGGQEFRIEIEGANEANVKDRFVSLLSSLNLLK